MDHKQRKKTEYEIDLFELIKSLLKHWWVLLLTMAIGIGLMFLYTRYIVVPEYRSSVSFYVNNGQRAEDKISTSDISASQSLVDTYIVILKYGTTLDAVLEDTKINYSAAQLSKKITCASINDTEVFQVTVSDPSPELAATIARSIEKILPDKVADVIEGSTVRVVRNPSVPTAPSSPNMIKNLVLGGLAGLMLSCVYVSLRYTLDDRIRDASRMLKDTYSFPVLAVIPELSAESKGYYYNSYTRKSIHDEQKKD